MATNLTPQQLAELQRLFSTGSAFSPGLATIDGRTYQPTYSSNGSGENYSSEPSGYYGFDSAYGDLGGGDGGKAYSAYGLDGTYGGDHVTQEMNAAKDFAKFAAIAGALGGGLYGLGFGGAGGAGAAGSLAGDAFLPGALGVDGAAMSTGALPGLEGYLAAGSAGGAAGAGTGAMSAGSGGGSAGGLLAGDAVLPGQLGVNGANMSSAALPGLESYVTGTTGGLFGLGKNALGIGASLLGAAAGAQGQNAEQSSTRDIPEWLKPYAQKVLGYGGSLLDQQMQPGAMAGFDQMKSAGQGLLGQPIAGNGTSLFPARPTLFRR